MNPALNQPPMTNREIALDFAIRMAITVGDANGASIVRNAEVFLAFLEGEETKTTNTLSVLGAVRGE